MRVVIAGSGDIGFHLARLLASENQDIVLIDINQDLLDYANSHLDVFTIHGNASSPEVLDSVELYKTDLFIAVTTSETTNIVSSILAKKKGAKQTIARISNSEYLKPENLKIFQEQGIDKLISPSMLATEEIKRLLEQCEVTDMFEFEDGRVSLAGVSLDDTSLIRDKSIKNIREAHDSHFNPIAILRGNQTILPRKDTVLRRNDHIYFLAEQGDLQGVLKMVGKKHITVKNIMILGGSYLSLYAAQKFEQDYNVSIISSDKKQCEELARILNNSNIIQGDPGNFELLKEEGITNMDVFLALTPNAETNILTSLMADQLGVYKTIALVDNHYYTRISQNIGVDTMINKKIITANYIFRFVRKGNIEAITSLHGVDAEIIEYHIRKESVLTKKPIRNQRFPDKMVIGTVLRDKDVIIPNGDTVLKVDDKVIVLALPQAIQRLERIFTDD